VKNPRRLWASVILVSLVSGLALAGLWSGRLSPSLGLDLQGGVAVILSAPEGTPSEVMDQALENIRRRVDGFGVAEPDIFTSGTTIEVQIPGATDSTVETRPADTYCLIGVDAEGEAINLGCNEDEEIADEALAGLVPTSRPTEVCLVSGEEELGCFGSQEEAAREQTGITIVGKNEDASPSASATATPSSTASPSASPTVGPGGAFDEYCLTDFANEDLACYDSQAEAQAVLDGLTPEVTEREWCIAPEVAEPEPTSTPTPTETPTGTGTSSASATPSVTESPSPTAEERFGQLTDATDPLPCAFDTKADAEAGLGDTAVEHVTERFCVVSSQGEDLGCFVDRAAAEERQRETGQQRLLGVIGQTARLEERATLEIVSPQDPRYATLATTCGTPEEQESEECKGSALDDQEVVYLDGEGNKVRLGPVIITGGNIEQASGQLVSTSQFSSVPEWVVTFDLDDEGSEAFATATRTALTAPAPQNQIAIVVDRTIVSNPTVTGVIDTGTGQITGGFTEETARDLGTVLSAGALPVELTIESVRTVSPTLGEESLTQGIIAGIAGLLLLLLYLLLYYRMLGVVAWLGMTIWSILALALVSVAGDQFGYSLTLAGVAGLIISLGVTADSYIVFFERLKDELRGGKSPRTVVQPAFKRAFRTIVAADAVTFIAAAVLYVTAVSSVRGFALTLGVATLLDLFVVYFFKRPTVFLLTRSKRLASMKGFGLAAAAAMDHDAAADEAGRSMLRHFMDTYRGYIVPNFRIVERMKRWFIFSGVLIVLSLIGLAAVRINLSIDFEGGTLLTYPLRSEATVEDIQATLEDAGVERAEVQIVTDREGESVVIRGEAIPDEEGSTLRGSLAEQAGVALDDVSSETVGPTWGSEVSRTALRGLIVVLVLIGAYIAFRFQPAMALGAMIALVHDVVITGGIYALTAREVTPETVIAVLTILGFSLYDTVVIYDKIQENTESPALMARMSYADVVNLSLNQTLMRSVNTSLVVLLPIASLLLFGGDTLKDFAFAMFVGVTIGAYSSVFIAAPVLVLIRRRSADTSPSPVPRSSRQAVAAAAAAEGAVASVPPSGAPRPRPKGKRRPQPKRKRR
jgi:protein-export membrane protein SecD/preprotein translocase SecF subunit